MSGPARPTRDDNDGEATSPSTPRWRWNGGRSTHTPPWPVVSAVVLMMILPLSTTLYHAVTGKSMPGQVMVLVLVAAFAGIIGVALFMLVRGLKLWKPLIEHSCRLCLRCHYPLPEDVERGTCPECGLTYELKATVAAWRKGGTATWRR